MGRGVVAFDYDRDGDLDLLVANNGEAPRLFRNEGSPDQHALTVRLDGVGKNTQAIGARLWVTAGGRTQLREVRAGGGFESRIRRRCMSGSGPPASRGCGCGGRRQELTLGSVGSARFLALSPPLSRCASGNGVCALGGRARRSDCLLRTRVEGAEVRDTRRGARFTCVDGDPTCDRDPDIGACRLRLALCAGAADARVPACTPANVSVVVEAADPGVATALATAAGELTEIPPARRSNGSASAAPRRWTCGFRSAGAARGHMHEPSEVG